MRYEIKDSAGNIRYKRPNEIWPLSMSWANDLESGDAVTSHVVTATDGSGADVTGTILSNISLAGTISSAHLRGGRHGGTYLITFLATTGAGLKYQHEVILHVANEDPE